MCFFEFFSSFDFLYLDIPIENLKINTLFMFYICKKKKTCKHVYSYLTSYKRYDLIEISLLDRKAKRGRKHNSIKSNAAFRREQTVQMQPCLCINSKKDKTIFFK
ncbi:hypothetical protein DMUE_1058 [Dictyocoela muelleri]|nr:hypothetical protein DMUE_1058 [Dictyocoela muelleri]